MNWCLMSSDVSWHIRNKLWPIPKDGSINFFVHGNQKARQDGQPRTSTSTLTQLLNYDETSWGTVAKLSGRLPQWKYTATQSVSSRLTRDWLTWNWSSQSELRGKMYAKYLIFLPKWLNLNQLPGNRKKGCLPQWKLLSCVLYGKPATVRSWLEADFDLLKLRIESELRGLTT